MRPNGIWILSTPGCLCSSPGIDVPLVKRALVPNSRRGQSSLARAGLQHIVSQLTMVKKFRLAEVKRAQIARVVNKVDIAEISARLVKFKAAHK